VSQQPVASLRDALCVVVSVAAVEEVVVAALISVAAAEFAHSDASLLRRPNCKYRRVLRICAANFPNLATLEP
jgi:hypothetical protein